MSDATANRSAASGTKPEPKPTIVVTAAVHRRRRLSPSFARITLVGEGLERFAFQGYDQWFRMFIPREGEGRMPIPAGGHDDGWYSRFQAAPEEQRTWMRYVTVADFRTDGGRSEMDVDVVVHGEPGDPGSGPLSTWAQTVNEGDRVALLDQGPIFRPELADQELLLLGDETAVPAISGILKRLPSEARGRAFIEVPYADDVQDLAAAGGVSVTWLPRHGIEDVPGQRLLDAVREHVLPPGTHAARPEEKYVYAAGEMKLTKALNQLLRQEHDWPKDRLHVVGYWHFQGGAELR
ncbi:MAG TPA: siderophore-interacting protein [Trueperaceae bacterium]|nr:siderophore-interacting protein [Trueperaceae bacterium]